MNRKGTGVLGCLRLNACLAVVVPLLVCARARPQNTKLPDSPRLGDVSSTDIAEAQREIDAGRFPEAAARLQLYLQHAPSSAEAHYLLAYALMRDDKPRDALAEYTQAASLRRPTSEELRGVAQAYVLLGDYADADKWLKASLQMDPKSADSWYNLGRLRYTQNLFAQAVQCFQQVLLLVPHSVKAENNLGLAYEGLDRNDQAERAYRQAIAWQDAGPASAASEQPLLNLATLLLHGADPSQAGPLLLRAVAIAPKDSHIHEQLGQMYVRQSQYADAAREFKTATELDPGRSSLHFLLGQAYKHLGKQTEAAAEFAQATRLANAANAHVQ